jgi:hypothetical protein
MLAETAAGGRGSDRSAGAAPRDVLAHPGGSRAGELPLAGPERRKVAAAARPGPAAAGERRALP